MSAAQRAVACRADPGDPRPLGFLITYRGCCSRQQVREAQTDDWLSGTVALAGCKSVGRCDKVFERQRGMRSLQTKCWSHMNLQLQHSEKTLAEH